MSDDKTPKNQGTGSGTATDSGTNSGGTGSADGGNHQSTTIGFTELLGTIDQRIESTVRKVLGGKSEGEGEKTSKESPESVAQQVRNELLKLNSEEAEKQKRADQEVTIKELQEQVTKLSEAAPTQQVSKLTQILWGGKKNG